jgi:hypothetical protein
VRDQPASPAAGLVQSLLIKAQRIELDRIGAALGTPVLYLKAAWADPVLYGGRGERVGTDIDVLVSPGRFEVFAQVLETQGFRRVAHPSGAYERYFGHKEWSFQPPAGQLAIDLHRQLTEPVWWSFDSEALLARARAWPSVDGPILSLDAEDQLLYAAAHYANHLYDAIDGRHLGDCERLLAQHPIDWELTWQRARMARMRLPLALLVDALAARGVPLAANAQGSRALALRLRERAAGIFVTPTLGRRRPRTRLDHLLLRPLLSDKPAALPEVVLRFGVPWLLERARRRWSARAPR